MIQNRIDSLKPYFKGIKIADDYKITEFNFKKDWSIPQNEDIEMQQKATKESNNILYTMFYSKNKNLDEILDFVEEGIIKRNLEIEQKEELLRMKVEELKRVFEDRSLTELNNLKFTTEENSLKLNGSNLNNKKDKKTNNESTKEFSTNG